MEDHYTISLRDGKYTVINTFGKPLEFLRHGEPWPGADDLRFTNVVIAMADRIQELEITIKGVLDGTVNDRGIRRADGLRVANASGVFLGEDTAAWEDWLTEALEQRL